MSAANRKKPDAARPIPLRGRERRDLVFGLGETGLSVARYLKRAGRPARFIDTRKDPPGIDELARIDPAADVLLETAPGDLLKRTSRVIVSPGVPDREPLLVHARAAGIEVVSDIELFAQEARAPFIGVTGSNGKSTVTTLLALMFEAAGRRALSGANLGHPALDLLTEAEPDVYVLELSSFQLMRTRHLPAQVAVLLNITTDHLDWHASEAEYREAKHRIFREAKAAVFNREDPEVEKAIPDNLPRVSFGAGEPAGRHYGIVEEDGVRFLACGEQMLLETDDMALVGEHNHANALAAIAAGRLMGLDYSPMLQVLMEFPGLPHRMQLIAEREGVEYVDDSKATNVGAAVASVLALGGPVVLIAGGDAKGGDKGGDFADFAEAVCGKLRAAILIGRDGPAIARALKGKTIVYQAADMRTAIPIAASLARPGDTVLLAPACASFDQYRN
ncbi:MAG TPA: UDP-N-acetylmuramoyl-L-alanine--D-glutamate ligase, partial [Woeseiaceae bacterium]|nr:UDP-N-acetylmuramoyl-L-alanine--D-glutamate ligase [Woeseiaceae bacterium]